MKSGSAHCGPSSSKMNRHSVGFIPATAAKHVVFSCCLQTKRPSITHLQRRMPSACAMVAVGADIAFQFLSPRARAPPISLFSKQTSAHCSANSTARTFVVLCTQQRCSRTLLQAGPSADRGRTEALSRSTFRAVPLQPHLPLARLRGALDTERPSIRFASLMGLRLSYGTGGRRESPPGCPTISGSTSSRDVDEIRKSSNPGAPGDATLSVCMSSTWFRVMGGWGSISAA